MSASFARSATRTRKFPSLIRITAAGFGRRQSLPLAPPATYLGEHVAVAASRRPESRRAYDGRHDPVPYAQLLALIEVASRPRPRASPTPRPRGHPFLRGRRSPFLAMARRGHRRRAEHRPDRRGRRGPALAARPGPLHTRHPPRDGGRQLPRDAGPAGRGALASAGPAGHGGRARPVRRCPAGGAAAGRMTRWRGGTDPVPAIRPTRRHTDPGAGPPGKDSLAH